MSLTLFIPPNFATSFALSVSTMYGGKCGPLLAANSIPDLDSTPLTTALVATSSFTRSASARLINGAAFAAEVIANIAIAEKKNFVFIMIKF